MTSRPRWRTILVDEVLGETPAALLIEASGQRLWLTKDRLDLAPGEVAPGDCHVRLRIDSRLLTPAP